VGLAHIGRKIGRAGRKSRAPAHIYLLVYYLSGVLAGSRFWACPRRGRVPGRAIAQQGKAS
jgi:hypothetical protein